MPCLTCCGPIPANGTRPIVEALIPRQRGNPDQLEFNGAHVAHGVDRVVLEIETPASTAHPTGRAITVLMPDTAEDLGNALIRQAQYARALAPPCPRCGRKQCTC